MKAELLRKGIHSLLALTAAVIAGVASVSAAVWFGMALFVAFAAARVLGLHAHVPHVPRITFGELFFGLGIIATGLITGENVSFFQLGMLVLAFADPFAALIGMRFGKHDYHVLDEKRTLEGSAACLTVLIVIFSYAGLTTVALVGAALVLTLVEALAPRGSDNLFLPSLAVLTLLLLV
jgi:phytol kinase